MAMDDALIAVFDAKYAYNFWRPITAIRNGDTDGNQATERDPGWTPFIDTPMHPEYPCAHCIVSASLGAVLDAEIGTGPAPRLSSASSTAGGAVRTWPSVDDFVQEVAVGAHLRRRALPLLDGGRHRHGQEGRRAGRQEIAQGDSLTSRRHAGVGTGPRSGVRGRLRRPAAQAQGGHRVDGGADRREVRPCARRGRRRPRRARDVVSAGGVSGAWSSRDVRRSPARRRPPGPRRSRRHPRR